MAWIYIFIAAAFETCWTFCFRYLEFRKIPTLRFSNFFTPEGYQIWIPLLGYIVFGIGNIYFMSMAFKQISVATAFAVWTSVSIVLIKLIELKINKTTISLPEIFFLFVIIAGIVGLKAYSTS